MTLNEQLAQAISLSRIHRDLALLFPRGHSDRLDNLQWSSWWNKKCDELRQQGAKDPEIT